MRVSSRIIVFCLLTLTAPAIAGNQIYRYKDDSGTLNFTTELYSIPEKYRSEAVALVPEAPAPVERNEPALRVVTATGEYRMGEHDTRTDATRLAIEAAKRQALEQVAMYLESVTEVKNLDVTRDEIRAYSAGIVTVLNQQVRTRIEDGSVVMRSPSATTARHRAGPESAATEHSERPCTSTIPPGPPDSDGALPRRAGQ